MTDELYAAMPAFAAAGRDAAVAKVLELSGHDRGAIAAVRNRYASRVAVHSDDFEATAALRVLNQALATDLPPEPLDWKQRWAKGRKP